MNTHMSRFLYFNYKFQLIYFNYILQLQTKGTVKYFCAVPGTENTGYILNTGQIPIIIFHFVKY